MPDRFASYFCIGVHNGVASCFQGSVKCLVALELQSNEEMVSCIRFRDNDVGCALVKNDIIRLVNNSRRATTVVHPIEQRMRPSECG